MKHQMRSLQLSLSILSLVFILSSLLLPFSSSSPPKVNVDVDLYPLTGKKWGYTGSLGPSLWYRNHPLCENKLTSSQSPITIDEHRAIIRDPKPINVMGYNTYRSFQLTNNGHTVVAAIPGSEVGIFEGDLPDDYTAAQFHFHWGSKSVRGSEHIVNFRAYPLEVQIVHYGAGYGDLRSALQAPNGLAILSILFEISDNDNTEMIPIVDALKNVKYPGNKTMMDPMALKILLPNEWGGFYRYTGSLTTPGCHESVIWTVFGSTLTISERQLQEFRSIYSREYEGNFKLLKMVNNYRPVQPVNSRIVYKYSPFQALTMNDAGSIKASLSLCPLVLVLSLITLPS